MNAQKAEGKTMDNLKKSVIIFGTAVGLTALALGDANAQNTSATPYINYLLQQNRSIDAILRTLPPDAVAEGRAKGPAWNPAPRSVRTGSDASCRRHSTE